MAKHVVTLTYKLVKNFPANEKFCLINQMTRAAISIPSNIAEGTSRNSTKDKIHFINIAYASMMELTCQYEIALELGYIKQEEYNNYINMAEWLSVKLTRLSKSYDV